LGPGEESVLIGQLAEIIFREVLGHFWLNFLESDEESFFSFEFFHF
jgi:hypothetical protein